MAKKKIKKKVAKVTKRKATASLFDQHPNMRWLLPVLGFSFLLFLMLK
ncbi:MAG: hypothetical protein Q8P07_00015 [bacterium]|nr:hypothetical protein [bacterium]